MIWVTDKSKSGEEKVEGGEAPRHGTVENWFHFAVVLFSLWLLLVSPPFFSRRWRDGIQPLNEAVQQSQSEKRQ